MDKVLITGGAGFIGFHLAKLLAENKGHRVDLLDNFQRGARDRELQQLLLRGNVRLLERDVLFPDWQTGLEFDYDHIYHLAAIIGVAHVLNRPFEVLKNNILMLLSVLDFCKKQKNFKRLVFVSTSEVYAGTLKHFTLPIPTPETTPLALTDLDQPRTSYMLSKIYGEALCYQLGLPFSIIRPHNFYGPRMGLSHVIPELLQRVHASPVPGVLEVFSSSHRRTFCYIDDAVRMIKSVAEQDSCQGTVFNIGRQEPEYTMAEVAGLVLEAVGKTLTIVPREAAAGSPVRRCPDMSKTSAMIGYTPTVALPEGLQRTYAWYRESIFEGQELSAK